MVRSDIQLTGGQRGADPQAIMRHKAEALQACHASEQASPMVSLGALTRVSGVIELGSNVTK